MNIRKFTINIKNIKISFLPNASSSAKEKIKNNGEKIAKLKIKLYFIFLNKKYNEKKYPK